MSRLAAIETIEAMRQQEENGYAVDSNVYQNLPQHIHNASVCPEGPVDILCRSLMANWCRGVVDYCKFDRETVSISMSLLDRFMASEIGQRHILIDRNIFQLAAMACFYTAVKIHEPEAISPKTVAFLSQGMYTAEQVEAMEVTLLQAIEWRVNPPTAMSYIRELMTLIPSRVMSDSEKENVLELSKIQTEIAVQDSSLFSARAWSIATSSLLNAVEWQGSHRALHYLQQLLVGMGLQQDSKSICGIQKQLFNIALDTPALGSKLASRSIAAQSAASRPKKLRRRSSFDESPRSVFGTA